MSELTWEQNREQLNRQLAWQAVRNEFYSQMCWQNKNTAAHNRAYGGMQPHESPTALRKLQTLDSMNTECADASGFYYRDVCEMDRKLKTAMYSGDAVEHLRLLDEANLLIAKMPGYTTYGCYASI